MTDTCCHDLGHWSRLVISGDGNADRDSYADNYQCQYDTNAHLLSPTHLDIVCGPLCSVALHSHHIRYWMQSRTAQSGWCAGGTVSGDSARVGTHELTLDRLVDEERQIICIRCRHNEHLQGCHVRFGKSVPSNCGGACTAM